MATNPFQNFMVRYGANERIFTEGDLGTTMYIVQSGKIRLFRVDRRPEAGPRHDGKGGLLRRDVDPRGPSANDLGRGRGGRGAHRDQQHDLRQDDQGNIEIAIRMLRKLSIRLRETERRFEGLQADGRSAAPARPSSQAERSRGRRGTGTRLEVDGDGTIFARAGNETLIGRFDPVTEQMPDVDLTPSRSEALRLAASRPARPLRTRVRPDRGSRRAERDASSTATKLVTGRRIPCRTGTASASGWSSWSSGHDPRRTGSLRAARAERVSAALASCAPRADAKRRRARSDRA